MGRIIQLSDLRKRNRNISRISRCHRDIYSRADLKNSIFNMLTDGVTSGYRKNKYGSKFLLRMPNKNISQDLYSYARIKLDLKNIAKYYRRIRRNR